MRGYLWITYVDKLGKSMARWVAINPYFNDKGVLQKIVFINTFYKLQEKFWESIVCELVFVYP